MNFLKLVLVLVKQKKSNPEMKIFPLSLRPSPLKQQLGWSFSSWPAQTHHPEPVGTSFEGERVIVSHVRSVLSPSSETARQVPFYVYFHEASL